MKRLALFTLGILIFALQSAYAQNTVIFGSYDDWTNSFSGSGGYTVEPTSAFNYGDITANGIGNPTAPGVTSGDGAGALQVSPNIPWAPYDGPIINAPAATTPVVQALDGPNAGYGNPIVAQSGTMYVYYTRPDDDISGSFWDGLAVFYNSSFGWNYWFPSSEVDLGPVSTPSGTEEMYEDIIPYSIPGGGTLGYFDWGFDENTDYTGSNPWYIFSLQVAPLPVTQIPAPVTPLFITGDDFNEFTSASGDTTLEDTTWSESNNITDGIGNTNTAGATGTAGSLEVYWSSVLTAWGPIANGPFEQANNAFMEAVDPGCNTNTATTASAYGSILMDFSMPDTTYGGTYLQIGISFSYAADGYSEWAPNFDSSIADLGYTDDNGDEVYQATIPYTINGTMLTTVLTTNEDDVVSTNTYTVPGLYYGFTPYIFINSDYQPANPFHISNISVSASQAPQITSVSLNGNQLALSGIGGLTGYSYNVLQTTNLVNPVWVPVVRGIPFNGPDWSATNTISAQAAYYQIQTLAP